MRLIRRISATLTSSVDRAIARVENHDAIIDAGLRDARLAAARSQVRLDRLRKDGAGLEARRRELENAIAQWSRRATQLAGDDEERALECLRRRRVCAEQLGKLKAAIESHRELETRIAEQVRKIDARIGEMSEQRNRLRSRQSVADAMLAIRKVEGPGCRDIEDTFDRWEIILAESEYRFGTARQVDPLDSAFASEEQAMELRSELALLLADEEGNTQ
jgi:phage shock protein A